MLPARTRAAVGFDARVWVESAAQQTWPGHNASPSPPCSWDVWVPPMESLHLTIMLLPALCRALILTHRSQEHAVHSQRSDLFPLPFWGFEVNPALGSVWWQRPHDRSHESLCRQWLSIGICPCRHRAAQHPSTALLVHSGAHPRASIRPRLSPTRQEPALGIGPRSRGGVARESPQSGMEGTQWSYKHRVASKSYLSSTPARFKAPDAC